MYNLLVTADTEAWDNKRKFYEYDASRFLEYTNEKLVRSFSSLSESQIELLKSLPCVFAYEGEDSSIKIGYLTKITPRGRAILIEYEFDDNIPPIDFKLIKPIAPLLDIRGWEMNRTHWAVKEEDLFERLKAENIIEARFDNKFDKPKKIIETSKEKSGKVSTVKGFIEKVIAKRVEKDDEVFYRGHANKNYKLEPSLFRKDKKGNYLYLDNEHILYRELLVSNSADFSGDEYTLDKLVRMQHYSLPTRLLDITSNPLIALYFACKSDIDSSASAEVVIFTLKKSLVKYFDSDTASCIANLARLSKVDKDSIEFSTDAKKITQKTFNDQSNVKRLIHFIREEKSFFEPAIKEDDLRSILCVKGKKTNDRISFQSGAFLLFGLDAILDEAGSPDIKVHRIEVTDKQKILEELDLLNINDSTVFPNIENSAKYVANKHVFRGS